MKDLLLGFQFSPSFLLSFNFYQVSSFKYLQIEEVLYSRTKRVCVFICRSMRCTEPPAPVSRRRSRSSPPASWPTRRCRPPPLTPPPLQPGEPSKSRSDWFRELQVHLCYSDPALLIPPNVLTAIHQL